MAAISAVTMAASKAAAIVAVAAMVATFVSKIGDGLYDVDTRTWGEGVGYLGSYVDAGTIVFQAEEIQERLILAIKLSIFHRMDTPLLCHLYRIHHVFSRFWYFPSKGGELAREINKLRPTIFLYASAIQHTFDEFSFF